MSTSVLPMHVLDHSMLPTHVLTFFQHMKQIGISSVDAKANMDVRNVRKYRILSSDVKLSLTLVDAQTDQDIGALTDGDVIDLSRVRSSLNVRADGADNAVTAMVFLFDGVSVRTETVAPFSLGGDLSGDYKKYRPLAAQGPNVIEVRAMVGNAMVGHLSSH